MSTRILTATEAKNEADNSLALAEEFTQKLLDSIDNAANSGLYSLAFPTYIGTTRLPNIIARIKSLGYTLDSDTAPTNVAWDSPIAATGDYYKEAEGL